jgi:hypothetical protein
LNVALYASTSTSSLQHLACTYYTIVRTPHKDSQISFTLVIVGECTRSQPETMSIERSGEIFEDNTKSFCRRRIVALVPVQALHSSPCGSSKNSTLQSCNISSKTRRQQQRHKPWIKLFSSTNCSLVNEQESIVLGRKEFLRAYQSTCPQRQQHHQRSLCERCQHIWEWGRTSLSRSMIKVTRQAAFSKSHITINEQQHLPSNMNQSSITSEERYRVQVHGPNAFLVRINDIPVLDDNADTTKANMANDKLDDNIDEISWVGDCWIIQPLANKSILTVGSDLSFEFKEIDDDLDDNCISVIQNDAVVSVPEIVTNVQKERVLSKPRDSASSFADAVDTKVPPPLSYNNNSKSQTLEIMTTDTSAIESNKNKRNDRIPELATLSNIAFECHALENMTTNTITTEANENKQNDKILEQEDSSNTTVRSHMLEHMTTDTKTTEANENKQNEKVVEQEVSFNITVRSHTLENMTADTITTEANENKQKEKIAEQVLLSNITVRSHTLENMTTDTTSLETDDAKQHERTTAHETLCNNTLRRHLLENMTADSTATEINDMMVEQKVLPDKTEPQQRSNSSHDFLFGIPENATNEVLTPSSSKLCSNKEIIEIEDPNHYVIFILPLGRRLPRQRIEILTRKLMRIPNVTVILSTASQCENPLQITQNDKDKITHIVIDETVPVKDVVSYLELNNEEDLVQEFTKVSRKFHCLPVSYGLSFRPISSSTV